MKTVIIEKQPNEKVINIMIEKVKLFFDTNSDRKDCLIQLPNDNIIRVTKENFEETLKSHYK